MNPISDVIPENPDPDELAALIDGLMESGVQHIDLKTGNETRVRTVNSTALCENGACAVPTLGDDPDEEADENEL